MVRIVYIYFLKLTILFYLIGYSGEGYTQDGKVSIVGRLMDSLKQPIEAATVKIVNEDSINIDNVLTDTNGNFIISRLLPGRYNLYISHLLFDPYILSVNCFTSVDLKVIVMKEKRFVFDEVVIKANRIKRKAGGYTILLKDNPVTDAKNIYEVFDYLPGVSTNNGLSINGVTGTQVYLNGRKITDQSELQALQAVHVDEIEVIYTAGAAYDAQQRGGIINIKLKKLPDGGFYGSLGGDVDVRIENRLSSGRGYSVFNYRYKKWSLYNSLSYNAFNDKDRSKTESKYCDLQTSLLIGSKIHLKGYNLSEVLSLTCDLNNYHRIGGTFKTNFNRPESFNYSETEICDSVSASINTSSGIGTNTQSDQYQGAVNYYWQIDKRGSALQVIGDFLSLDQTIKENHHFYQTVVSDSLMRNSRQNKRESYEAEIKLELALNENSKILTGGRYYHLSTKRNLLYEYLSEDTQWLLWGDNSDYFKVKGEGGGAYFDYKSSVGKGERLSYELGLRVQLDKVGYHSFMRNVKTMKEYWGIYPTVNLDYALDTERNSSVYLAYSRGIDYIPFTEISPAKVYSNEYFYTVGNPDLKITVTNSLDASVNVHNWNFYYSYYSTLNDIHYLTFSDEKKSLIKYSMPVNVGKSVWHIAGGSVKFKPFKWWTMFVDMWIRNKRFLYPEALHSPQYLHTATTFFTVLKNNFNFDKWGGVLNFQTDTKDLFDDKIAHAVFFLNANVYKYFFNKKLTACFEIWNPVYKARELEIRKSNYWSYSSTESNMTFFRFSLVYNFKRGKNVKVEKASSIQRIEERIETK